MKLPAHALQPGDVVTGTKETVCSLTINSIHWPTNKVQVVLEGRDGRLRQALWGKFTQIGIQRD